MTARGVALAAALLGAAACGADPPPRRGLPPTPGGVFVALERDFQGFRAWERAVLPGTGAQSITHLAGRRTEYVNARPPGGAAAFPVGTILVKEIETGAPAGHQLFAMVKRGGGFNARGARGWEWFELRARRDGSVGIVWRGLNAPDGESYGGDPMGGCNGCHETAMDHDYVKARAFGP